MSKLPSVTIITTVLNQKSALSHTLKVLDKIRYPHLQVVVIDAASTDGTRELIQSDPRIDKWISEPDKGIADGFNKGLALADGEYINFQGAGDYFIQPDVLTKLMTDVDSETIDLICGQVQRVSENNEPLWVAPKSFTSPFDKRSLLFKMSLPHQGLFTHRRFFEQFGKFDTKVKFAMDYELLLRAYHQFPKVVTKEIVVAAWQAGGIGTGRLNQILDEYHAIKCQHQVASRPVLNMIHQWNKLKAFGKSVLGDVV